MAGAPTISPAEWEVMRALWTRAPMTANEVVDALPPELQWHPKTVRTLLDRLAAKGALQKTKMRGVYEYAPLVEESACLRAESRGFAERFFGGRLRPMIAHFIEHEDLSQDDIAALRRLLDQKDKNEGA